MRFEPKLVSLDDAPESAAGELQLPDDLQALAEQLSDDAARLHALHPPVMPAPSQSSAALLPPTNARTRSRVGRRVLVAAAAIVGLAVIALPWREKASPSTPKAPAPTSTANQRQQPTRNLETESLDNFGAASAPEREALLDLSPANGETIFVSF